MRFSCRKKIIDEFYTFSTESPEIYHACRKEIPSVESVLSNKSYSSSETYSGLQMAQQLSGKVGVFYDTKPTNCIYTSSQSLIELPSKTSFTL